MTTKEAFSRGIKAAWHGLHEATLDVMKTDAGPKEAASFEAYMDVVQAMTGRTRESIMHALQKRVNDRLMGVS